MKWKIDFGERPWHRWYAWFPVRVENDRMVWLEYVERHTYSAQGYKIHHYRLLPVIR